MRFHWGLVLIWVLVWVKYRLRSDLRRLRSSESAGKHRGITNNSDKARSSNKTGKLVRSPSSQKMRFEDITGADGESMSSDSNNHCSPVSKWKSGPGRSKGWKQSRFVDLWKWHRWSGFDDSRHGNLSALTLDVPRLAAGYGPPAATQRPGIPSDMLRSYGHRPKGSGRICHYQSPTDRRRAFVAARGDSRAYRDHFQRPGVSKSKALMEASVKNDFATQHASGYEHSDVLTEDDYPCDIQDRLVPTHSLYPTTSDLLKARGEKDHGQAANAFIVPYQSHIGAILESRFQISAYIRSEACYDYYVVEDLLHEGFCFAKAYTIRGRKGKEHSTRISNLKRGSKNASLMASIDQNGRKWLVFSDDVDLGKYKEVSPDPLKWLGEKDFQTHFPSIDGMCRPCHVQRHTFPTSHASCFYASKESSQNRSTIKVQRARRQQRKRRERRAIKRVARHAFEVEDSLLEGRLDSVEPSADPDVSTDPAPTRSSLEIAYSKNTFSEESEQSDSQDSRPPRGRQRRKRQERRAIKVAIPDAVEVKDFLLKDRGDSVEPSADPDVSTDPAPTRSSLEIAYFGSPSSEESEQSDSQDSRPPTPPKPANLRYRSFEIVRGFSQSSRSSSVCSISTLSEGDKELYESDDDQDERIPCGDPLEKCLACKANLPMGSPTSFDDSPVHIMNPAKLRHRNCTYQKIVGGLLPSKSPWRRLRAGSA